MEQSHIIHVLMVEDNTNDVLYYKGLMKSAPDCQFNITNTPRLLEAERLLLNDHFDLILLDLRLADSQPLETVDHIPALLKISNDTPVVVLSGSTDRSLSMKAVLNGASDYLVKDQHDATLVTRIMQHAVEFSKRIAA